MRGSPTLRREAGLRLRPVAESMEDATSKAIARAAATVRNMRWFKADQVRDPLDENKVAYWQSMLNIGSLRPRTSGAAASRSGQHAAWRQGP